LFVDLDGFKDINDTLGHDVGDYMLTTIARHLQSVIRDMDFVSRLGGDEFCIILDHGDEADAIDAAEVATRCLKAVNGPVDMNHAVLRPQASIGIARFPEDGQSSGELLKAADSAMYAAKRSGKHRYAYYQETMTREAEQRLALEQAVRSALEQEQFKLHYQPQVDLKTGCVIGVEALIRCDHPELLTVPPIQVITIAERIGLIGVLGQWVLQEAGRQMAAWRERGFDNLRLSVNVSPHQLASSDLLVCVRHVLDENRLEPSLLELEITESTVQSNIKAVELMSELKKIGVRIAIDDFGTGYSSLGSLKHLPIDTLKIDRLFIKDILENIEDSILLGTITGLAHALDYQVVGEGVEHLEQVTILSGLGCDIVQGYFFSEPVNAERVAELFSQSMDESLIPKLPLKAGTA
jgi:diguanylate cyclase (GGDEF)-like protein